MGDMMGGELVADGGIQFGGCPGGSMACPNRRMRFESSGQRHVHLSGSRLGMASLCRTTGED
jgi:hypothetical protein